MDVAPEIAMAVFVPVKAGYLLLLSLFLVGSSVCIWLVVVRLCGSELLQQLSHKLQVQSIELTAIQEKGKRQEIHLQEYVNTISNWNEKLSKNGSALPVEEHFLLDFISRNVERLKRCLLHLIRN